MRTITVKTFYGEKSKKRKKMGRPKIPQKNQRNISRQIALRYSEAIILRSAAKKTGKSFSSWAREILLEAAKEFHYKIRN
jgi:predicted HicB family RNase H-like nuclease